MKRKPHLEPCCGSCKDGNCNVQESDHKWTKYTLKKYKLKVARCNQMI
jgi:hypothetical protein